MRRMNIHPPRMHMLHTAMMSSQKGIDFVPRIFLPTILLTSAYIFGYFRTSIAVVSELFHVRHLPSAKSGVAHSVTFVTSESSVGFRRKKARHYVINVVNFSVISGVIGKLSVNNCVIAPKGRNS